MCWYVDGVLVRCLYCEYQDGDPSIILPPEDSSLVNAIEMSCVLLLKDILDRVKEAKIVVSSTWRESEEMMRFLLQALKQGEIDVESVVGTTPILGTANGGRGAEVLNFLANNAEGEFEKGAFVILDDDHANSFAQHGLAPYNVLTKMSSGLTEANVFKACEILEESRLKAHE